MTDYLENQLFKSKLKKVKHFSVKTSAQSLKQTRTQVRLQTIEMWLNNHG